MPIGNYTFQLAKPLRISLIEIETLLLSLLKDICETSSNLNLKNTRVNYANEFNLGDLSPSVKGFLTFFREETDQNVNLGARYNDEGSNLLLNVTIGLLTRLDIVSYPDHLLMFQEVIDGLCFNYNSGQPYFITYNGCKIATNLTKNRPNDYPQSIIDKNKEINYLSTVTSIVFNIFKLPL